MTLPEKLRLRGLDAIIPIISKSVVVAREGDEGEARQEEGDGIVSIGSLNNLCGGRGWRGGPPPPAYPLI